MSGKETAFPMGGATSQALKMIGSTAQLASVWYLQSIWGKTWVRLAHFRTLGL